ncbi:hypothetical protein Y032_0601g513 [Ancylostoma ceylanicum]|uniref:Uncharacterized protein n=1 Tax=Ancylostoma ceylanicum TaxID=53326 RepID=A0A016WNV2_9BILA|nr:hypothetical protein Y032_0601g513 [Ancylostoma ceylanicum]
MILLSRAGAQHVVEVADVAQRSSVQVEQSAAEARLLDETEPSAKRPRLSETDQNLPGDLVATREEVQKQSLELSPVHEDDNQGLQPLRRRRIPRPVDMDGLFISYESIKKMQNDYSSLLKTKDELKAGMTLDKHPTLRELLLPYPAYAGNRFPKKCIELYRSRFFDKLTYEQALNENLFDPVDRGPESKLWRYSSSEQSSKEVRYPYRMVLHAPIYLIIYLYVLPHYLSVCSMTVLGVRDTSWHRILGGDSREVCFDA